MFKALVLVATHSLHRLRGYRIESVIGVRSACLRRDTRGDVGLSPEQPASLLQRMISPASFSRLLGCRTGPRNAFCTGILKVQEVKLPPEKTAAGYSVLQAKIIMVHDRGGLAQMARVQHN
ncbi:unnamed protein product [Ectocarpus sp. 13 AM-2016]